MSALEFQSPEEEVVHLRLLLEQTHQQLVLAQKMGAVGELASSITHEFNNILTTVINYAKLGLRHQDQASRDKAFNKILEAGQRASKITTGLLAYARNGSDRRDPHPLAKLVEDVLVLVEKDFQKHRISLEYQVEGDPYALVSSGQIQQVLLNLIVNARQAMQPGGRLSIKVTANENQNSAEISLKDTGTGIPADALPKIFDRFYTTKTADQDGQGGTGLGLALCRDIVESHGGRIRVESAIDRGTRFTLIFPATQKPALLGGSHFPQAAFSVGN